MASLPSAYMPMSTVERIVLHQFTWKHCAKAREMVGWSCRQLARHSGVSVGAIERFERGEPLRDVTRLALAFRFEAEGLVFFPGFSPSRGMNVRGNTPDPVHRDDFEMIE